MQNAQLRERVAAATRCIARLRMERASIVTYVPDRWHVLFYMSVFLLTCFGELGCWGTTWGRRKRRARLTSLGVCSHLAIVARGPVTKPSVVTAEVRNRWHLGLAWCGV